MIKRFSGESGRHALFSALLEQKIVANNLDLAQELSEKLELVQVERNDVFIEQGGTDSDLFLILSGACSIYVNGKCIANRFVNDHVGEMSILDPSQPRSASIIASEKMVLAKITESDVTFLAEKYPSIYRVFAKELSKRLFQRNSHVTGYREKIKIFIISSVESLDIARVIQSSFEHDEFLSTIWTDGVFRVASYTLQSLMQAVDDSDFAIAIAHADDVSVYRGQDWPTPRDNVIFELGLFMGRLGKDRAILMEPRDQGVRLPSDLAGITTIPYKYENDRDKVALLAPACNKLREHIKLLGPNN